MPTKTEWVTGHLYKHYDGDRFKELLELYDSTKYYTITDPDQLWSELKSTIDFHSQVCAP